MKLTLAFCTYNRVSRLEALVAALRAQSCPVPFEILAVNNNSPDNTLDMLEHLAQASGAPLRYVTEMAQGIVPARNRAIEEALDSDILVFIDDDELPQPGLLQAAYHAIAEDGADCAGGRVVVDFTPHRRPAWLEDNLLGFLAEVYHGDTPFWITNGSTPIWTANIAYNLRLFRDDPNLRFDKRYNREGSNIGGGEDGIMLRALLGRGARIRYRPDMAVWHFVEPLRLKRRYFLRLHYQAGLRMGKHELPAYPRTLFGIPPFLLTQCMRQGLKASSLYLTGKSGALRQAMNAAHAMGSLVGYRSRS